MMLYVPVKSFSRKLFMNLYDFQYKQSCFCMIDDALCSSQIFFQKIVYEGHTTVSLVSQNSDPLI